MMHLRARKGLTAAKVLIWALGAGVGAHAWAARPMTTEDADSSEAGQCQVEAWTDHDHRGQHAHLSPACGLVDGVELGAELIGGSPASAEPSSRALSLKWTPTWLTWEGWIAGIKAGAEQKKSPNTGRWGAAGASLTALASRHLSDDLTLHINLGHYHSQPATPTATLAAAGLAWTPQERWLVFAELQAQHQASALQQAGVRWWLLPDQLGLDLTAGRSNGVRNSRSWGLGLGWYGLSF
jgi:hypothetical protein